MSTDQRAEALAHLAAHIRETVDFVRRQVREGQPASAAAHLDREAKRVRGDDDKSRVLNAVLNGTAATLREEVVDREAALAELEAIGALCEALSREGALPLHDDMAARLGRHVSPNELRSLVTKQ